MDTKIINVRLPSSIASWLDQKVRKGVYESRSEAIREFIRAYIREGNER